MADIITNVKTADIQIVDETRSDITTVKLDNPRENLTKADISTAFSNAFANEWLLTNKSGRPAKYLGDVTINTSTKVKLGGEDYYVTPSSLSFASGTNTQTLTVSGAYIQGYNVTNLTGSLPSLDRISIVISENGLTASVTLNNQGNFNGTFNIILVIQGIEVIIPVSYGEN